jgi:hypothetical protein
VGKKQPLACWAAGAGIKEKGKVRRQIIGTIIDASRLDASRII